MPISKEKYRSFCDQHPEIPLFLQAWWLDACSPQSWQVLMDINKETVRGIWVLQSHSKWGQRMVLQPVLTPYAGTYLFYPEGLNTEQRSSFEYEVMQSLIAQWEDLHLDFFEQRFHPSFQNWQPFYWKGFHQTTQYTYQLHDLQNSQALWEGMSHRKRQKPLKKCEHLLTLSTELSGADFYDFYASTLSAKGKKILYSKEYFLQLHQAAQNRGQGQILALYDTDHVLHVALWIVWDAQAAYNMVIAIAPEHKSSGASTRIIWEAIQWVKDKTACYDFEGSMIQGVALKNQSFGATAVPYSRIWKISNPLLQLWYFFKQK